MSKPSLARSLWLAGFCITLLVVPVGKAEAREAAGWKCGDWVQDPSGKCEEVRVCTRLDCPIIDGKIDTSRCTKRTNTECANPRTPQAEPGGGWREQFRRQSVSPDRNAERPAPDEAINR